MGKTDDNLKEAFAGESQANRKYMAYAEAAEREGLKQAARLFRAAAEAEAVHALNHLRAMGVVKGTVENLQAALGGETYEFEDMYPPMIEAAGAEGNKRAETSFRYANEVEKIHAGLFSRALEGVEKMAEAEYHVCQVCGNTVEGEPPEKCPVCGSRKKMFKKVL